MKKFNKEKIKIAIQKSGRLTEDTLNLLQSAGLEFSTYNQTLFSSCRNFPIEILFLRDDDIPNCVDSGIVDFGIAGLNIVKESGYRVKQLLDLDFGYCSLAIAVPKDSRIGSLDKLEGKRVATSYPKSVKKYFTDKNINVKIVKIEGSVEISPALGMADAIADIVSTGSTLALHDLKLLEKIFESNAVVFTNPGIDQSKMELIKRLLTRFKGVMAARTYKYIMMNAPKEIIKDIQRVVPGLKSPTIAPLMNSDWYSVQTVVREDIFWETVEKLKDIGASGIIVLPIEKLIR
ncbi:MAG: ATP phosphoribosyltransferase [Patescibacteria group bacterium]|jgi:ATP phosphoribosyltransferase